MYYIYTYIIIVADIRTYWLSPDFNRICCQMGSQKVNGIIRIPVRWNPNLKIFFAVLHSLFVLRKFCLMAQLPVVY